MATYESWLNQINTDTLMDYTNEQIISLPIELCPVDWFNPWLLTEQEIDTMRQDFKGGSLKWSRFVEEKLPQLNPKLERQLKIKMENIKKASNCGKIIVRLDKKGLPYYAKQDCNQYDNCIKCSSRREHEHFERLLKLDGCQYVVNQRKETVALYGASAKTYSFKLPNGDEITVVDTEDKIEGAKEMSYEIAKSFKGMQISGTHTSGKLGTDKKEKPIEQKDTTEVIMLAHSFDVAPEIKQQIEAEYFEQTKDFQPLDTQDMKRLLYKCQAIWIALMEKYCDNIHFVSRNVIRFTEDDLDWTDRKEYIKKWQERASEVQHTPAKSPIST